MKHRMPRARIAAAVFGFFVVAIVALVVFAGLSQQARIDDKDKRVAYLLSVIQAKNADYANLLEKYTVLSGDCDEAADCITTAPAPSQLAPVTIPGESGRNGENGAQGVQGIPGPKGDIGTAGQDGSPGPTGQPGATGTDGSNGAQGDAGPAGAQGEPGPAGQAGADGTPGRGITSGPTCNSDGTWTTTFTDGTTETQDGPCRVSLFN